MAAQPKIISRREWGAASSIPGGRSVAPSQRRFYVVHYPVMSARDERQWCRDVEAMHRRQGWQTAPGYNYLIGQSGTIYEGCGRDIRGIHSPPHNTDGWGVCHLQPSTAGGSPTAPISDAMKAASWDLYTWLSSVAARPLQKWYHGKDYATACPGPDLRAWVEAGMPAPSAPKPPAEEDITDLTTVVNAVGATHVFVEAKDGSIWYSWQRPGETAWQGGQAGKAPAGLRPFAPAPK